jgi:hypothetical protein
MGFCVQLLKSRLRLHPLEWRTGRREGLKSSTPKCYVIEMQFEPDIVVTIPGESRPYLVVEAKLQPHMTAPLKHYMLRMRSPAGLLVTRDLVTILRDTFRGDSEDSIEEVGAIPTSKIPELQPFAAGLRTDPVAFEDAVQEWLVQLRNRLVHGYARGVDPILAEHVMPALAAGEIRAGGPRPTRSAAG